MNAFSTSSSTPQHLNSSHNSLHFGALSLSSTMAALNAAEDRESGEERSTFYLEDLSRISSENVEVHVAITGEVGSGRSSFVNAIAGLNPNDENSAKPGERLEEGESQPFSPHGQSNINFWILPKIDSTYPAHDEKLQKYDIFLIFTASSFTAAHEKFAERVKRIKKPFILIKTKIERDLPNAEEEDESTKKRLNNLRESLPATMRKLYGGELKIFLVSDVTSKLDFGKLTKSIVDILPCLKSAQFSSIPIVRHSIAWEEFQHLIEGLSNKTLSEFSATRESLLQHGIVQVQRLIKEELKLYEEVKINFAVVGNSGVGKSSFVNAIRGLKNSHPLAVRTGVTETTKEATRYCYPINEDISFWDLPGAGSKTLPDIQTFCEKVRIEAYDAFLIICATRFTNFEIALAERIRFMGKSLFLIRTKIDQDVENVSENENGAFDEEELLTTIRRDCAENGRLSEDDVFLISSRYSQRWDFERLKNAIVNRLSDIKKEVLTLSLRANSEDVMKEKINILKGRVWKVALASCVFGGIGTILNLDKKLIKSQSKSYRRKLEFPEIGSNEFNVLPEELQTKVRGLSYLPNDDEDFVSWLKSFDLNNSYNIRKLGPFMITSKPLTFVYGFLHMMLDQMGKIAIEILDQTARNTQ